MAYRAAIENISMPLKKEHYLQKFDRAPVASSALAHT